MSIPLLNPVSPWPTRKGTQERFDSSIKKSMDQMSSMVDDLNIAIPEINSVGLLAGEIQPHLSQIAAVADSSDAVDAVAPKIAEVTTVATNIADVVTCADNISAINAAPTYAQRAETAAEKAEGIAGAGIATPEKIGLVKPDGTTIAVASDGTISSVIKAATAEKIGAVKPDGTTTTVSNDGTISVNSAALPPGGGNAATLEISEDLHLTSESPRKMAIAATAPNLKVYMPLSTDIDADGVPFMIVNYGVYPVQILDHDSHSLGADLGKVGLNEGRAYVLVDKAIGLWAILQLAAASTGGRIGEIGMIIDAAAPVTFASVRSTYFACSALSDTKVLVAYIDYYSNKHITFVLLSVSETTIVVGESKILDTTYGASNLYSCALSTTRVLVSYHREASSTPSLCFAYVDIANDSISITSILHGPRTYGYPRSLAKISNSKFIVAYNEGNDTITNLYVSIGSILESGTISYGPELLVKNTTLHIAYVSLSMLSPRLVVLAYAATKTDMAGKCISLAIDETSVSLAGDEVIFNENGVMSITSVALSSNKVLLAYYDGSDGGRGKVSVLNVDRGVSTPGVPVKIEEVSIGNYSLAPSSENTAFLSYTYGENGVYRACSRIVSVKGDDVSFGDRTESLEGKSSYNLNIDALETNKAVLVCQYTENSTNYFVAQILTRR